MTAVIGTSAPVFIGVTLVLMGFAAFMTGQALATAWKPVWQVALYSLLLGIADRFLTWALFQGVLLSPGGYAVGTTTIFAIAFAAHRLTLTRRMTAQYPWLYERAGLFSWRPRRDV